VAAATEHTVVVKEDDLVAESIAKVQKSIIRIVGKGSDTLIARGIITSALGAALTDAGALSASGMREFEAILPSGERVEVSVSPEDGVSQIAHISLVLGASSASPVVFTDVGKLMLGQSVIRIGGVSGDTVGAGVIAMLPEAGEGDVLKEVQASVSWSTPGSVLITLFGEVVGVATGTTGGELYSVPASLENSPNSESNPTS
jgi:S1-C subfamily serine protease